MCDFAKKSIIICDTREKENYHIIKCYDSFGVKYKKEKLDVGDYGCEIDGVKLQFVIERKFGLNELISNITQKDNMADNRFVRELKRSIQHGLKLELVIENDSLNDIYEQKYISRIKPQCVLGFITTLKYRYDIYTSFIAKMYIASYIYNSFKNYYKVFLEKKK